MKGLGIWNQFGTDKAVRNIWVFGGLDENMHVFLSLVNFDHTLNKHM
jgi:hypothetical protein